MMLCKNTLARRWGPRPRYMPWLYTAVIRPQMLGCYVWAKATKLQYIRDWLRSFKRLGLMMIGHVRRGCPTGALELIYDVKPLHIAIRETAMATYFRVKQHNWNARLRAHIGHEQYVKYMLPIAIKDIEADKMPFERKWNRPYKTIIGKGEGPGNVTVDWEVYTDGSLLDGKSGSGVVFKKNNVWVDCLSVPLRDATVYQSELKAIELAASELQPHVSHGDTK